jgi:hypothetical protein
MRPQEGPEAQTAPKAQCRHATISYPRLNIISVSVEAWSAVTYMEKELPAWMTWISILAIVLCRVDLASKRLPRVALRKKSAFPTAFTDVRAKMHRRANKQY